MARAFMCCMCLLFRSPEISVHVISVSGWQHLKFIHK